MWQDLFAALALMLVIEGIWPFLSPDSFRRRMRALIEAPDQGLRTAGLVSMIIGLLALYLVR